MTAEHDPDPLVVDGEVAPARAVDPPPEARRERLFRTLMWATEDKRRPIVPAWLRSREDAAAGARFIARHGAHVTAYHATRSPKYAARLLGRAPVGVLRVVLNVLAWWWDREGAPLRRQAVDKGDLSGYMTLTKERNARVRTRGLVVALVCGALIALCVALLWVGPGWARFVALGAVVVALGVLGTPPDRPVLDRVVNSTGAPVRLTADIVTRALSALGIAGITAAAKNGPAVTFPAPISRDGPGWRADVDLPHGVTFTDVQERREKLASGLRRPLGCVWPEPAEHIHAGRLVLWVGDQDLNAMKAPTWPLAKPGATADLFAPFAFGTDQRGRAVPITLMFASLLIGAMPRFGKTFAMRLVMLAAALDVTAELRVFELKGTGDLAAVEGCCHRYGSGPGDDETVGACVETLREVHADLERRAKVISSLPKAICPENKVTPDLARRTDLGLHPLVIGVDECQELFTHEKLGGEADRLATAIIKRGPAMGVMLVLATQRPDKDSLPKGISANVGIRFCLRVMGHIESDMVLGTKHYRANTFGPRDKGIGYLVGAADDPLVTRGYYIDGPAAEAIGERARALREAAGRLSGHAVGDHDHTPEADLLEDLATVWVRCERTDRAWLEELVALLGEHRPAVYAGWKPAQLTAALKPLGIETGQVWGQDAEGRDRNRRGLQLEVLTAAIDARGGARPSLAKASAGPSAASGPSSTAARSSSPASGEAGL